MHSCPCTTCTMSSWLALLPRIILGSGLQVMGNAPCQARAWQEEQALTHPQVCQPILGAMVGINGQLQLLLMSRHMAEGMQHLVGCACPDIAQDVVRVCLHQLNLQVGKRKPEARVCSCDSHCGRAMPVLATSLKVSWILLAQPAITSPKILPACIPRS